MSAWLKHRDTIWERDQGICQICGHPVTPGRDATIDHIVPRVRGGTNDLDNLRLAHRHCNAIKSANGEPIKWNGRVAAGRSICLTPPLSLYQAIIAAKRDHESLSDWISEACAYRLTHGELSTTVKRAFGEASPYFQVKIHVDIVAEIQQRIGRDGNRAGWIMEACQEKLERHAARSGT